MGKHHHRHHGKHKHHKHKHKHRDPSPMLDDDPDRPFPEIELRSFNESTTSASTGGYRDAVNSDHDFEIGHDNHDDDDDIEMVSDITTLSRAIDEADSQPRPRRCCYLPGPTTLKRMSVPCIIFIICLLAVILVNVRDGNEEQVSSKAKAFVSPDVTYEPLLDTNDALIDKATTTKTTTSSSEGYETATSNTNNREGEGGRIIEFTVANLNTNAQNCTHNIPNTQILQCIPSHNNATNKFRIQLYPEWAPVGVRRFEYLTISNFWNGVRIFRIVPNFISQFGLSPDPAIQRRWSDMGSIDDDPSGVVSNMRGMVSFATSGPDTRTTQVFINTADNPYLDDQGFSPIGQVLPAGDGYGGMEVIDEFYSGYGGKPNQSKIRSEGEAYLSKKYPLLSYFVSAEFVDDLFAL